MPFEIFIKLSIGRPHRILFSVPVFARGVDGYGRARDINWIKGRFVSPRGWLKKLTLTRSFAFPKSHYLSLWSLCFVSPAMIIDNSLPWYSYLVWYLFGKVFHDLLMGITLSILMKYDFDNLTRNVKRRRSRWVGVPWQTAVNYHGRWNEASSFINWSSSFLKTWRTVPELIPLASHTAKWTVHRSNLYTIRTGPPIAYPSTPCANTWMENSIRSGRPIDSVISSKEP